MTSTIDGLFSRVEELPNASTMKRFAGLVGLDEVKTRLVKEARVILDPAIVDDWNKKHHKGSLVLADSLKSRPPLFIFGGDVGTGKTELAETFGDAVARECRLTVRVYSLSLSARGSGAVGEMTRLISAAFERITSDAKAAPKGKYAALLVIDEADALAQSREFAQMHHEDRAGVNALIRGVDDIARLGARALVVMCTNRLEAIDPAVRRRAAGVFEFARPNQAQRVHLLTRELEGSGFSGKQIEALAERLGDGRARPVGFTYSDITQRYLPALLVEAFPDRPLTFDTALALSDRLQPTPPFQAEMKK